MSHTWCMLSELCQQLRAMSNTMEPGWNPLQPSPKPARPCQCPPCKALGLTLQGCYEAPTQHAGPVCSSWATAPAQIDWEAMASSSTLPACPQVDCIFADVAQPDQARIVGLNAQFFLKNGGFYVISIKASCIDSTAPPEAVFAREVKKLTELELRPKEQVGPRISS